MMRQVVSRRQFGSELRRLRLEAGVQQREIAEVIECDASQISKVERGERTVKQLELKAILHRLDVRGEDYSDMMTLGERARARQSKRKSMPLIPNSLLRLRDFEEDAVEIFYVSEGYVPDLLQTPEYTSAISEIAARPARAPLETLLEFAADRQSILDRKTPLWFGVGETALRRQIGSRTVMRDQLQSLLSVAAKRPWIQVQVVLANGEPNPLAGNEVSAFRFGPRAENVIYQSTVVGGGVYWHEDADTKPCLRAFRNLRGSALGVEPSRLLISRRITELAEGE
ncbi:helix-turn-helix domain-containing protein [Amycolatopsis sp. NPDC059657]|uniref:helix-turn-helix domain-containing protein n=1 Tax=Amycolatopsis sp. NPDC059657 TaxID=3346899 RepID=UPI00366E6733